VKPFFAMILIAISCSLLGVFVLWKKISYLGDSLSHASLLGLALGALFAIESNFVLIFFAIIFATTFLLISKNRFFAKDSIIAILSYSCVAAALLLNDLWIKNFSFSSYVFGDVLTVENSDLALLFAITLAVIFYVIFAFKKILLICTNQELAKVEGINVDFWQISFLLLFSVVVALFSRIVGVFLMTALFILPAAIARIFCISAKQMMLFSVIAATCLCAASFKVASSFDLTVNSTIVAVFSAVFFLSLLVRNFLTKS
jgi:zinc transport system permease protein